MSDSVDTFNRPEDTIRYLEARVEALTKALENEKYINKLYRDRLYEIDPVAQELMVKKEAE